MIPPLVPGDLCIVMNHVPLYSDLDEAYEIGTEWAMLTDGVDRHVAIVLSVVLDPDRVLAPAKQSRHRGARGCFVDCLFVTFDTRALWIDAWDVTGVNGETLDWT